MPARLPIAAIPLLPTNVAAPGAVGIRDAQMDEMAEYIIAMTGDRRPTIA